MVHKLIQFWYTLLKHSIISVNIPINNTLLYILLININRLKNKNTLFSVVLLVHSTLGRAWATHPLGVRIHTL
jgi:hypothetical protein